MGGFNHSNNISKTFSISLLSSCFNIDISRYISLFFSFIISLHVGTLYVCGIYVNNLQNRINHTNTSLIYAIGHAGYLSSLFIGIFYLYFGFIPTMILSVGFLSLSAYLITITKNYALYCLFFYLMGLGSGGIQLAIITRNCENFSIAHRGKVMGLLIGGAGSSAVLWITVYTFIINNNFLLYFQILSLSTLIFGILSILFVESLPYISRPSSPRSPPISEIPVTPYDDGLENITVYEEESYHSVNITGMQIVRSNSFWLLVGLMFIGYGTALTWSAEMGLAMKDHNTEKLVMLYIFATSNALARLFTGFFMDTFIKQLNRAKWLFVGLSFLFAGNLMFTVSPTLYVLQASNIFLGIGYGAINVNINALVSILYGSHSFGLNNGILHIFGALGTITFTQLSYLIANNVNCSNVDAIVCYRYPFVLALIFVAVAIMLAIIFDANYPNTWLLPFRSSTKEVEPLIEEDKISHIDVDDD